MPCNAQNVCLCLVSHLYTMNSTCIEKHSLEGRTRRTWLETPLHVYVFVACVAGFLDPSSLGSLKEGCCSCSDCTGSLARCGHARSCEITQSCMCIIHVHAVCAHNICMYLIVWEWELSVYVLTVYVHVYARWEVLSELPTIHVHVFLRLFCVLYSSTDLNGY